MRLSEERVKSLKDLLREHHGLELTDEQAQEAGLRIMRFLVAKAHRNQEITKYMEIRYGQSKKAKSA